MSEVRSVPIATPATGLAEMIGAAIGAAVVVTGGIGLAIGAGTISACKEVYKRCKEGGYPIENLKMAYTPINNFDGFSQILKNNGFKINSFGHPDISIAINPLTSENLFIVNSVDGIGIISDNKDLIQSSIQSFATQELAFALEEIGFKVTIEEKGKDKVITARGTQRNYVDIKIGKGAIKAEIDTRRSKRPKCDIIQQLISQKLREPEKKKTTGLQREKRHVVNNHIHIKQKKI
ncbi:MAG: hypothetical protein QMC83_09755 [Thermodesulfovibrionales bacterium]|nr:hypothetical protein [Thermodesulfovibrionales bacterium]